MISGQQTAPKDFPYGTSVSIPVDGGKNETCYCVDQNLLEIIASHFTKNSNHWWLTPGDAAARRRLAVWKAEYGYLAYRFFRYEVRMLSHQLLDRPILFPTIEIAQTAAGLCFPKPNRQLGIMWWTYPEFYTPL